MMAHKWNLRKTTLCILACLSSIAYAQQSNGTVSLAAGSTWSGTIFGDVGGDNKITPENFAIIENSDGSILMRSSNNRGKIAGSSEGIAFAYQSIPLDKDFEIEADVTIRSFNMNNQVSCGLMVRDIVYDMLSTKDDLGSYVAVGPINCARTPANFAFSRIDRSNDKTGPILNNPTPAPDVTYSLRIRKSGNSFALDFANEQTQVIQNFTGFKGENLFVGLFTARNCEAVFSNIKIVEYNDTVARLKVDTSAFKSIYLIGQELDLSGLKVSATVNGISKTLGQDEYFAGGFNSEFEEEEVLKTQFPVSETLTVHYRGQSANIPITIEKLKITNLAVAVPPIKTEYYPGEEISLTGLTIDAVYNNGYITAPLSSDQYSVYIDGETAFRHIFKWPGTYTAAVKMNSGPEALVEFPIQVKDAKLTRLIVERKPLKNKYIQGESFDPRGLLVSAVYSDGKKYILRDHEYSISELNSKTPGWKTLTIQYLNTETSMDIWVEQLKLTGIIVKEYPRTTIQVGASFDPSGMIIAKLYSNGMTVNLPKNAYTVNAGGLNTSRAGTGTVKIIPDDSKLASIQFMVSVVDPRERGWQFTRFGQSSSERNNNIEYLEDGSIYLTAANNGGKITGDHDGISFYYTEINGETENFILEADITVNRYAKSPHDGQESFGLMARDAIGQYNDSSIFASNIVGIGGYTGSTRRDNGTRFFMRSGVTSPDGAGSQGVDYLLLGDKMPGQATTYPEEVYHLRLRKTNSGYYGSLHQGTDGSAIGELSEGFFWEPDILTAQDKTEYVGFYTAREADIIVHNISFIPSLKSTDERKQEAPPVYESPSFIVLSPSKTSLTNYTAVTRANVDGTILVKAGTEIIARDIPAAAMADVKIPLRTDENDKTPISFVFYPDEYQDLTNYGPYIRSFVLENRTFDTAKPIYAAPFGKEQGDGSREYPVDINTALTFCSPGQKVILANGTYKIKETLIIQQFNDGTETACKYLEADSGARPVIDFQHIGAGMVLSGDYWHFKGIDIARSAANIKGLVIGGDHNIIENCRFYENGDTGCQISRTDMDKYDIASWPSDNLILNCESFDNVDPSNNNADGFAAKITSGRNNIFRNCLSHHNIDDGWDLYTKAGSGPIGEVLIENCIAYSNGTLSDGKVGNGDKNGFKLGGEGIAVKHKIVASFAFDNGAVGFTNNSNPAVIFENCYALDNAGGNLSLGVYTGTRQNFSVSGFASFQRNNGQADRSVDAYSSPSNYFVRNGVSANSSGNKLSLQSFLQMIRTRYAEVMELIE